MIQAGLRSLQWGLFGACAFFCAQAFQPFAQATAVARVAELAEAPAVLSPGSSGAGYAVITTRNLFGGAAEAAPAPAAQIEQSSLSLKLVGVIAPRVAIVQDAGGKRRLVRAGDELVGGARVERVEPRRVIVLNQGKREALEFAAQNSARALALRARGDDLSHGEVARVASRASVTRVPAPRKSAARTASPPAAPRVARGYQASARAPLRGERLSAANTIPTGDGARLPRALANLRRARTASTRIAPDPQAIRSTEVELP